jgi:hypothetical protein
MKKAAPNCEKKLINNKCFLILGGSNIVQGLSADLLSNKYCEGSNLGLNSEFGGFYKYAKWLGYYIKSKNVIYSNDDFINRYIQTHGSIFNEDLWILNRS